MNLVSKPAHNLIATSEYLTIENLCKDWTAPAYGFYRPIPEIGYDNTGRRYHAFRCAARGCQKVVRQFLDKGDRKFTGNLLKHPQSCWGVKIVNNVRSMTADKVAGAMAKLVDGSITTHPVISYI